MLLIVLDVAFEYDVQLRLNSCTKAVQTYCIVDTPINGIDDEAYCSRIFQ